MEEIPMMAVVRVRKNLTMQTTRTSFMKDVGRVESVSSTKWKRRSGACSSDQLNRGEDSVELSKRYVYWKGK